MIYAADHLLDVNSGAIYSTRHQFVQRHRMRFRVTFMLILIVAAAAALRLPVAILGHGLVLCAIVGIYFVAVHAGGDVARRYWPKEFVIGAVFAAGSSITTWSHFDAARPAWLAIVLFAALCILNCCAVDSWEWQASHVLLRYPHRLTRWVARHCFGAAVVVIVLGALLLLVAPNSAILALLLSAVLLIAVARVRDRLSPEAARLLADAALLTPLFFLLR